MVASGVNGNIDTHSTRVARESTHVLEPWGSSPGSRAISFTSGRPNPRSVNPPSITNSKVSSTRAKSRAQRQNARVNREALDASIGFRARERWGRVQVRRVLLRQLLPN
jgi:hypothetical protein